MSATLYVDPVFLQWITHGEGGPTLPEDLWRRPYEIWEHADHLLTKGAKELVRVDVISALKRSVTHRVRSLHSVYNLRTAPIGEKPTDHYQLLEYFGIIRSLMLTHLLEIRNAVEHEDSAPPDAVTCRVLAEFAWYFLRSTDRYVRLRHDSFVLQPEMVNSCPYFLGTEPTDRWVLKVRGWLPADYISHQHREGWVVITTEKTERRQEWRERPKDVKGFEYLLDRDDRGKPDDLFFTGCIRGPAQIIRRFVSLYFQL